MSNLSINRDDAFIPSISALELKSSGHRQAGRHDSRDETEADAEKNAVCATSLPYYLADLDGDRSLARSRAISSVHKS